MRSVAPARWLAFLLILTVNKAFAQTTTNISGVWNGTIQIPLRDARQNVFISYLIKRLVNNQQTFLSSEALFQSSKIAVINKSANGQVHNTDLLGRSETKEEILFFLGVMIIKI